MKEAVTMEDAGDWRDVRDEVVAYLREENPSASLQAVVMYADAFSEYRAAMANIREHGSVVLHPRTGAPCDNPFLKVRDNARKACLELGRRLREVDALWWEVDEEDEEDDDEEDDDEGSD